MEFITVKTFGLSKYDLAPLTYCKEEARILDLITSSKWTLKKIAHGMNEHRWNEGIYN